MRVKNSYMGGIRPFALSIYFTCWELFASEFEYIVEKEAKGFAGKFRISIFQRSTKSSQMTCQRYRVDCQL